MIVHCIETSWVSPRLSVAESAVKIFSESRIHHPINRVYTAYRDELPKLADYIPDVKEIVVRSREERPGGPLLHNLWVAHRELPKMIQGIAKPEMMQWDDFADWNDAEQYVAWNLVIPAFKDQVKCSGRNSFYEAGANETRVVLTGDLQISLTKIPGVPSFMAKRLAPKLEEFIVKLITPNLERTNQALEEYLDAC